MRQKIFAVLAVLSALLGNAQTALSQSAADIAEDMLDDATWSGPVTLPNYRPYELKIYYSGGVLKADYPDLDCGGYWEPAQSSQGSAYFYERLTYGHFQCYDDGWVELRKEGPDRLKFYYRFHPNEAVDSWATLFRN